MIYLSLIGDVMNSKKAILLPKYQKIFDGIGENIKLARKRRKLTAEQVAERAGIHRATLHRVEKGDEFGRKLQDLDLL